MASAPLSGPLRLLKKFQGNGCVHRILCCEEHPSLAAANLKFYETNRSFLADSELQLSRSDLRTLTLLGPYSGLLLQICALRVLLNAADDHLGEFRQ